MHVSVHSGVLYSAACHAYLVNLILCGVGSRDSCLLILSAQCHISTCRSKCWLHVKVEEILLSVRSVLNCVLSKSRGFIQLVFPDESFLIAVLLYLM